MADNVEKKFLGTEGVGRLIENIRTELSEGDAQALADAKAYAEGLGDNYDAAGVAQTKVNELANGQVKANTDAIAVLNGAETEEGSVKKAVKDAKDELQGEIGTLESLETTDKDNIVDAINEVRRSVSAGGTAAAVSITSDTTSEGASKSYTVYQGDTKVGVIDIPKDMVVESGEVVVNPEGQPAGTYIKLVLANATNDEIFVNVGTLVDIYKAQANATQIQIAIDSSTREVSATVVAGSITSAELAANAVVTAKIADGNVTREKLSTAVQESLTKADNADTNAQTKADAALAAAKEYTDEAVATVQVYTVPFYTLVEGGDNYDTHLSEISAVMQEIKENTGDFSLFVQTGSNPGSPARLPASISRSTRSIVVEAVDHTDASASGAGHYRYSITLNLPTNAITTEYTPLYASDVSNEEFLYSAPSCSAVTAYVTSQTEAATNAAKEYADGLVEGVDLSGIEANATDIENIEKSLAEGGATANAIAEAKAAGDNAQDAVTSLTNGEVANLRTDVDNLKAVTYTEITTAEIDAMFAS